MNQLVEECYQREEQANLCAIKALKRHDFRSVVDCNEAAYRAVIDRYLLTTGKAREKSLSDLARLKRKYESFKIQLNPQGGTA